MKDCQHPLSDPWIFPLKDPNHMGNYRKCPQKMRSIPKLSFEFARWVGGLLDLATISTCGLMDGELLIAAVGSNRHGIPHLSGRTNGQKRILPTSTLQLLLQLFDNPQRAICLSFFSWAKNMISKEQWGTVNWLLCPDTRLCLSD